jgi:hypothetical protein
VKLTSEERAALADAALCQTRGPFNDAWQLVAALPDGNVGRHIAGRCRPERAGLHLYYHDGPLVGHYLAPNDVAAIRARNQASRIPWA